MDNPAIPAHAKEILLVSRPEGAMTLEQFKEVEVRVNEPTDGEILVRNEWMLLSVVLRELMGAEPNPDLPMPSYEIGEPPWTPTVGTVVRSKSPDYAVGDLVYHTCGFREYAICSTTGWGLAKLDRDALPGSAYHLFRAPGMTAWRGMVSIANVGKGDTVFVAGATSGVGSLAGQIAKCRGAAKVIGSTGSKDKIPYLVDDLGFDGAFDYHDGPIAERLAELAPDGIDVFFDNVGGEQFEAALSVAASKARFALCGALSGEYPTLDIETVVLKDVTIRGFITDYNSNDLDEYNMNFNAWVRDGVFTFAPTIIEGGITAVPQALVDQIDRKSQGVPLVKLS